MIQRQTITLYSAVTPIVVTSSTDATPIVVTATAHGLVTGDRVTINGHTTNIAANGTFKVVVLTANTFELKDELSGASIVGSGGGAGAGGVMIKAGPVLNVEDFRNIILQVFTGGTATLNLKVAGSVGKPEASSLTSPRYDYPNMGATINSANPYTFLNLVDLDTNANVTGATGIAVTGTDITKQYEVNINAQKYLYVYPATFTQGNITIKAILTSNA